MVRMPLLCASLVTLVMVGCRPQPKSVSEKRAEEVWAQGKPAEVVQVLSERSLPGEVLFGGQPFVFRRGMRVQASWTGSIRWADRSLLISEKGSTMSVQRVVALNPAIIRAAQFPLPQGAAWIPVLRFDGGPFQPLPCGEKIQFVVSNAGHGVLGLNNVAYSWLCIFGLRRVANVHWANRGMHGNITVTLEIWPPAQAE